jgi:hypothetical protein
VSKWGHMTYSLSLPREWWRAQEPKEEEGGIGVSARSWHVRCTSHRKQLVKAYCSSGELMTEEGQTWQHRQAQKLAMSKVTSAPLTPRTLAIKAFKVSIQTKILSQLLLLAGIHYLRLDKLIISSKLQSCRKPISSFKA